VKALTTAAMDMKVIMTSRVVVVVVEEGKDDGMTDPCYYQPTTPLLQTHMDKENTESAKQVVDGILSPQWWVGSCFSDQNQ